MHRRCTVLAVLFAATFFRAEIPYAATPSPSIDVAAADNALGFRLLNAVQKTVPGRNVVLSPVSAALNLSMVLNGAEGKTKQEILSALSLSGAEAGSINAANAQLIRTIHRPKASRCQ
jgi:serine protease inhibitor